MDKQEALDYLISLEETKIDVIKVILDDNDFDFLEKLTEEELWKILFLSNYCALMGFDSCKEN